MATKPMDAATRHATRTLISTALALLPALALVLAWLWSEAAQAAPTEEGKIAFTREVDRDPDRIYQIYAMNPDGSGLAPLTGDRELSDPEAAWSPDGQRIAFVRSRDVGTPPLADIWVMNADGSDQTNLTNNPDDPRHQDQGPTWSPDGQRIAFSSNRGWTRLNPPVWIASEIFAMNADGSDPSRLTEGEIPLRRDPAWSPDGQRIAFSVGGDGIWAMNADGSDETRLGPGSSPAWSPDGEKIAFSDFEEEGGGRFPDFIQYIYVMHADGSGVTRLTRDAFAPTWSPDGQRIAFERGGDIWAMNADARCQANLTNTPTSDGSPAWQPLSPPSGSQVCFTLSVSVAGSGTGTVTGPGDFAPGGPVSCGELADECAASFAEGTELTLTARPGRWSTFSAWGGACTDTGPCELTMDGDRQVSATFAAVPRLRVRARPRQRRVGPNKRRVRYRFVVRNVGDAPSGTVNLCARGPQRRVRIRGKRCVTRSIPPGSRRKRPVGVRIRPAARGKLTRIRLIARGPNVQNRQTVARLRVRR